jgi:hypothetical protein
MIIIFSPFVIPNSVLARKKAKAKAKTWQKWGKWMEESVYCLSVSPSVCLRMMREDEGDESRCKRGPHTRLFAQRSIDRPHARTQARERALSRSASSLHARAVSSSSFAAPLVRRWCLVCRSLLPSPLLFLSLSTAHPLFFLSSAPLQQQTNIQMALGFGFYSLQGGMVFIYLERLFSVPAELEECLFMPSR